MLVARKNNNKQITTDLRSV